MTTPTPYEASPGATICLGRDVPRTDEWRGNVHASEWVPMDEMRPDDDRIVECRPIRLPDPNGEWVWSSDARYRYWSTTVGEMRDRTDLDQWGVAAPFGYWVKALTAARYWAEEPAADSHPIIVRRTQP
jgi:hypothetical protein